jgi:hypothetical protein
MLDMLTASCGGAGLRWGGPVPDQTGAPGGVLDPASGGRRPREHERWILAGRTVVADAG